MPPPEKVIKDLPRKGDLQLLSLEKLHEFQCVRYQVKKKAKLVAIQAGDWSKLVCNGCYGLLLSKRSEEAR